MLAQYEGLEISEDMMTGVETSFEILVDIGISRFNEVRGETLLESFLGYVSKLMTTCKLPPVAVSFYCFIKTRYNLILFGSKEIGISLAGSKISVGA